MIHLGTSGFSYQDWKGVFYPDSIAQKDMLVYYAQQFSMVELDFTYYQMPGLKTIQSLDRKTPHGFVFCVKANKAMTTHEKVESKEDLEAVFRAFAYAIRPLIDSGKLGCVLAQFPWSFRRSQPNLDYLSSMRELMGEIDTVVEFRNSEWVTDDTFNFLRSNGYGYCCVDEPRLKALIPPVSVLTSSTAYVRFHGRNAAKWWKHNEAWERYDYLYSRDELMEWVPRIRRLDGAASRVFVLFNNCHRGQAAVNAKDMRELLNGLTDETRS